MKIPEEDQAGGKGQQIEDEDSGGQDSPAKGEDCQSGSQSQVLAPRNQAGRVGGHSHWLISIKIWCTDWLIS